MSIYSIGYGNRKMPAFLELLQRYQIQYLVDVRSAPYSKQNPEFSKSELHANLKENGINYLFLGQALGGRPDEAGAYLADGRVNYDALEKMPFYQEGIERLKKASEGDYQVVIMCSELRPHECHRSKLIGRSLAKLNIPLLHIDEKGDIKSQEEVMALYLREIGADKPSQLSLWGETEKPRLFTSRRSYLEPKAEE